MKRIMIASIVGGLILFIWQTLSFAILDLHNSSHAYTSNQDSILHYLDGKLPEGRYFLPTLPKGAKMEDMQKLEEQVKGKPWAIIDYHSAYNVSMSRNMVRGILVDIVLIWLLCWLLLKAGTPSFGGFVTAAVVIGIISFLSFPYTYYIWYRQPGIFMDLVDAVVGWGLAGAWLGWWFNRK
jgi:hypothetical protein